MAAIELARLDRIGRARGRGRLAAAWNVGASAG